MALDLVVQVNTVKESRALFSFLSHKNHIESQPQFTITPKIIIFLSTWTILYRQNLFKNTKGIWISFSTFSSERSGLRQLHEKLQRNRFLCEIFSKSRSNYDLNYQNSTQEITEFFPQRPESNNSSQIRHQLVPKDDRTFKSSALSTTERLPAPAKRISDTENSKFSRVHTIINSLNWFHLQPTCICLSIHEKCFNVNHQ